MFKPCDHERTIENESTFSAVIVGLGAAYIPCDEERITNPRNDVPAVIEVLRALVAYFDKIRDHQNHRKAAFKERSSKKRRMIILRISYPSIRL